MKRSIKYAGGAVIALGLGLGVMAATGQPSGMGHGAAGHGGMGHGAMGHAGGTGHGGMGGMGGMGHSMGRGMGGGGGAMGGAVAMLTKQDAGSAADMNVVHDLLASNTSIRRNVVKLKDGVRTVTESDDPAVAKSIQVHVASMSQRLQDGREFNIFSNTLPVLFENREKIVSKVEMTDKGAVVTRTSTDAKVVAALQGHSGEVTELVQDGMVAMRRGMMTRMAMNSGMGSGMGPGMGPGMGAGRGAAMRQGHDHNGAPAAGASAR